MNPILIVRRPAIYSSKKHFQNWDGLLDIGVEWKFGLSRAISDRAGLARLRMACYLCPNPNFAGKLQQFAQYERRSFDWMVSARRNCL